MTELQSADEKTDRRNPSWTRDELILALDLYLKYRSKLSGPVSIEVDALSNFLCTLGQSLGIRANEKYRNANSVSMKLQNFKRFDPLHYNGTAAGLPKGNTDEKYVWDEFASNLPRLATVVKAIRSAVLTHATDGELALATTLDSAEASEGRVLTRLHIFRERSQGLAQKRKALALQKHGTLSCEACGFNFSVQYGQIGEGLIEVHHTRPLHTLTADNCTKLADLALLCSNCHRVIHSRKKWLSLQELKNALRAK